MRAMFDFWIFSAFGVLMPLGTTLASFDDWVVPFPMGCLKLLRWLPLVFPQVNLEPASFRLSKQKFEFCELLWFQGAIIQCFPGMPGADVSGTKKPISQRKNLLIQFAHGHQPVRCPNGVFCVHQPSAVPFGGGVFVVAGCVDVV